MMVMRAAPATASFGGSAFTVPLPRAVPCAPLIANFTVSPFLNLVFSNEASLNEAFKGMNG